MSRVWPVNYGSSEGPHSDFLLIFHFSVFVFNVLIFTSPFGFSVKNSVFIFTFQFLFLLLNYIMKTKTKT